ncbi:microcin C transport system substrate-binding protein [Prosthecobacter debontii]|uniref:Microcin C transport system substrate-binding protein n=1 Tax=Prosthecobacter debontii TaxID=48467 RepID=A0A1T4WS69_9BACT|nr:extracellular solute-binding protein [Prosthecobacter debontii]SKA80174.1 microcin C transport system substrate-binding protein [Prosthecobacter debontii]
MRFSFHQTLTALLLGCTLLISACSRTVTDDRFPPYDNTEEVKAAWQAKPDLYRFRTPADLPPNLKWETGLDYPDMGSPEAKKGGTFNYDMPNYPSTLRFMGPDGNNTFRSEHYDNIEMSLLSKHLDLDTWIPGLANEWAVSEDRLTVFFRLDPDATYSDGVKVEVEDFFMAFYMSLSKHAKDPFRADYFQREFTCITKYDERTLSVTLTKPKPDPIYSANMGPMPRHFFREFTDDFPARYQWRKMPTAGAYDIKLEDVKFGRSITLTRVKNWWAKDKKYYRYRYNADHVVYRMISSMDKAFEMFRQGKLDLFSSSAQLLPPTYWYDKGDIPELLNGYIERYSFYNQYPRIPRCIFINQSKPLLDNLDIRVGLHHAFNMEKVISVVLRDDAVRMQSAFAGFGRFTSPNLRARPYDPAKAREAFTKAGFTKSGRDGVLTNDAGKRLTFTLSVGNLPLYNQAALIWKEDALKAGVDLQIESLDFTQLFKKAAEKKHELVLAGFGATPPYPEPWQFYHSDNAYEKGTRKPKTETNNFTQTANAELDKLIDEQREAPNEDEMQRLCWLIEEKVQEQASEIPTWEVPLYRYFHWRWLRWPEGGNFKFTREANEAFAWWIDEDIKEETQKAMREGRSFGEVSRVFEQFRDPQP